MKLGLIYKASSKTSSKSYIGQTTTGIKNRRGGHIQQSKKTDTSSHFHNAIKKYGKNDFVWEIIVDNVPYEWLDAFEMYWIDTLDTMDSGYNMTIGGNAPPILYGKNNGFFGKKHTKEAKTKMGHKGQDHYLYGKNQSSITKNKIGNIHRGRKRAQWERDNISEGRRNIPVSEKHKQKIKATLINKPFIICPHCNKISNSVNMRFWHFDNCKHRYENSSNINKLLFQNPIW